MNIHYITSKWFRHILIISFLLLPNVIAYAQKNQANASNDDLYQKILIGIVSVALTFGFNYVLARRKEKREKKEIQYSIEVNKVTTGAENSNKDVQLSYKGDILQNLSFITLGLKNTGAQQVNDEEVRITFDKSCFILDSYFEPIPEQELSVVELDTVENSQFERKIRVGIFKKGKDIKYIFVVSGENPFPKIFDVNPKEHINFIEKSLNKKSPRTIYNYIIFIMLVLAAGSVTSLFRQIQLNKKINELTIEHNKNKNEEVKMKFRLDSFKKQFLKPVPTVKPK